MLNKNIKQTKFGATANSGIDLEQSVHAKNDKYDIEISRKGKSISLGDSAKTVGSGKLTNVLQHLPSTNHFSTKNTLQLGAMGNTKLRLHAYKTSSKILTNVAKNVNTRHNSKCTARTSNEEQTDNTISAQSMDLKLEWLKVREEKRVNEEDKVMLQKQRKILEQQQMELEQEKIKLVLSNCKSK